MLESVITSVQGNVESTGSLVIHSKQCPSEILLAFSNILHQPYGTFSKYRADCYIKI